MKYNIKIQKFINVLVMIYFILILSCFSVQAAELKDLNCYGLENLSEETQNDINEQIKNIPDSVINLYNALGGKIYFKQDILKYNNIYDDDVMGLYYGDDYNIQILSNEAAVNNPNVYMPSVLVHELGHFLYHKTYSYLSEESKEIFENNYNYWKNHTMSCYNKNETFAEMYCWFRSEINNVDDATKKMYEEAENICNVLYEKMN